MTILIDGRPFTKTSAGISSFLKECLKAWSVKKPSDTFWVCMPDECDQSLTVEDFPDNVQFVINTNRFFKTMPNLVWLSIMMPLLSRKFKAGYFFSALPCIPFFLPKKMKKIIVVHDVVNIEFSQTMQWTNWLSNKLFFNRSIKNADMLWANSSYTKERIEKYFPKRKCKDIFKGCAVNRNLYHGLLLSDDEKASIRKKFNINGKFILFVGSLEPRKNLPFLLSIMPQIYLKAHIQLVVVGAKGWKNSSIYNTVENNDFPKESTVFCGFVPDTDLVRLYNMAECFVSASLNEGFGMPQLEALLCGCPVVTAHNSAMIEVAEGKDGAITVEGYDRETWIHAITRVIEHRPRVNQSQLYFYDWEKIIDRFLVTMNHSE